MNARLGFVRDVVIGALLIGGAIFILGLPPVRNFFAGAAASGESALATAAIIGAATPGLVAALYGLRKRRFGFAVGLFAVPLALASYVKIAQAEHAGEYAALESGPPLKPLARQQNVAFADAYWANFWVRPILANGRYAVFYPVRVGTNSATKSAVEWREARLVSGAPCREPDNLLSTVEFTANGYKDTCIAALPASEPARALTIKIGVDEVVKGFQGLWIEVGERLDGSERPVGRRAKGLVSTPVPVFLGNFGARPIEINGFETIGDVVGEALSMPIPKEPAPTHGEVTDEHEIAAALEGFFTDPNPSVRRAAEIEYGKSSVSQCPAADSGDLAARARFFDSPYLDVKMLAYQCVRELPPAAREPFLPRICAMIADAKQSSQYKWLVDWETRLKTDCGSK